MSQVTKIKYSAVIKFLRKEKLISKIIKDWRIRPKILFSFFSEGKTWTASGGDNGGQIVLPGRVGRNQCSKVKKIKEITKLLNISSRRIFHDHLGVHKISAK